MREIKFRGKRLDGEWVYGYYVEEDGKHGILVDTSKIDGITRRLWIEVDPETVGQFIGLRDKNGKEIYEGDRVNVKTIQYQFNNYVVEYFGTQYVARSLSPNQNGTFSCIPLSIDFEYEIISNIHDNPELLTSDKELKK